MGHYGICQRRRFIEFGENESTIRLVNERKRYCPNFLLIDMCSIASSLEWDYSSRFKECQCVGFGRHVCSKDYRYECIKSTQIRFYLNLNGHSFLCFARNLERITLLF